MKHGWWIAIAMAAACGGNKTQTSEQKPDPKPQPQPQPEPPKPSPPPAAVWTLTSHPVQLQCNEKPLALPAPTAAAKPAAPRKLARLDAIPLCQDQASPASVCTCLAKSVAKWGSGLSPKAECQLTEGGTAEFPIADVTSSPANTETTGAGDALVAIARHGDKWSALGEIEVAGDIDLSTTPRMMGHTTLLHVDQHALGDGALVWIETQTETVENSVGEHDHDGSASGTICIAPASAAPYCYASVALAKWMYSIDNGSDACTVSSVATYGATVDANGVTLRLEHGKDDDGTAGVYQLATSP